MPDEPLVRVPDGTGYRYERGSRPWVCSQHCEGCGELGAYTDTGLCDECEEVAAEHAAALRAAFRAGQERMRERAGHEADRTLLTPDPTVWKERPSALLGSRIRALPLEEGE